MCHQKIECSSPEANAPSDVLLSIYDTMDVRSRTFFSRQILTDLFL
jgi:hypothetical protein